MVVLPWSFLLDSAQLGCSPGDVFEVTAPYCGCVNKNNILIMITRWCWSNSYSAYQLILECSLCVLLDSLIFLWQSAISKVIKGNKYISVNKLGDLKKLIQLYSLALIAKFVPGQLLRPRPD